MNPLLRAVLSLIGLSLVLGSQAFTDSVDRMFLCGVGAGIGIVTLIDVVGCYLRRAR